MSRAPRLLLLFIGLLAGSAGGFPAFAADEDCLACHTSAGLAASPRPDIALDKLKAFMVDIDQFKRSNHGDVACKTCHGPGFASFPHKEAARLEISQCTECHAQKVLRIESQFGNSVHATHLPGKFSCTTCHDPHKFQVAKKIGEPRQIVAQDNRMCLSCHQSDRLFHALAPDKERPELELAHDWLPNTRLHWKAVRCVECHTPVSPVKTLALSHEILDKTRAEKNCVACHSQDSALRSRLYRHLVDTEQQTAGFLNSVILRDSYVIGATRNSYIDAAGGMLVGATVGGLSLHGLLRLWAGFRRRRRHD